MTSRVVTIGGTNVDFNRLPPLTQGDKMRLKSQLGIDMTKLTSITPEEETKLACYIAQRIYPNATEADIEALPARVVQEILLFAFQRASEVDSPFSQPST